VLSCRTFSQLSKGPLAESFPYISTDTTGRYLLGASYGGHLLSVNAIGKDGKVSEPQQVIPTARNAHAIITDRTNRYVYVPHLGTVAHATSSSPATTSSRIC